MIATNPMVEHAQYQADAYFADAAKRARGKGMTDADLKVPKGTLKKWSEGKSLPNDPRKRGRYQEKLGKFNDSF